MLPHALYGEVPCTGWVWDLEVGRERRRIDRGSQDVLYPKDPMHAEMPPDVAECLSRDIHSYQALGSCARGLVAMWAASHSYHQVVLVGQHDAVRSAGRHARRYSTGRYSTGRYSTGRYSTGRYSTGRYSTGLCLLLSMLYASLSGREKVGCGLWELVSRYLRRVGSTNTRARAKAYPELEFGVKGW